MSKQSTVIDDYLDKVDGPQREALERVRNIVMNVVPQAEDTIGYGMPVLKYKGKYVIGFAPFKDHMSIFPGASPVASLKPRLAEFKQSKGTIQFTLDNPIPEDIILALVQIRIKEIDSK